MDAAARRRFLADYARIRQSEGRGSDDATYYCSLPYEDVSGRNKEQWTIRGRSYRHFESRILPQLEQQAEGRPLDVLDLGAGNGWLSYRLTLRNHRAVALDIFTDAKDGLRATRHYPVQFPSIEAEFDHLPFRDGAFDVAIYNSSIHYSTDYVRTLAEVRRCLRPSGRIVIMDTPIYECREYGEQMKSERHDLFERQYGFRSDAVRSIEYFDEGMLAALARDLALEWTRSKPWYGWRWALRPVRAYLKGARPPSRFVILIGRFREP